MCHDVGDNVGTADICCFYGTFRQRFVPVLVFFRSFVSEVSLRRRQCRVLCTAEQGFKPKYKFTRKEVNQINASSSDDSETEFVYAIERSKKLTGKGLPFITLSVNNKDNIAFLVDTGSSVDIIDEHTWRKMNSQPDLDQATSNLSTYGSKGNLLDVIGACVAQISHADSTHDVKFHIVKGHDGCLLGHQTLSQLGVVNINIVSEVQSDDRWVNQYSELFRGVGLLKDTSIKLHIDESQTPVALPHRRVPFHLRSKVEDKIQELLDDDIIEPARGPTPWVSPIVTPCKPGNPDEIRLCVDMRGPNQAILRERHITPTIEDVLSDMNGACVFSKLDLNQGYHQLLLDETSRYITTFTTHAGLFRYKRLNFGISCASEIFQNTIHKLLVNLKGTLNVSDDILVYGCDQQQHDERLHAVLQRLQSSGLTLNIKKCRYSQSSVTYLGYTFGAQGISPDPSKVEAVHNANAPSNPSEVRSLLGLANYCARFIPDFATITAPLRTLTRKGFPWAWNAKEELALQQLKRALTSDTVMAYFNPTWGTELLVDASPVGVAAVLTQRSGDDMRVISYGSRALTPVEQRYSQIEREALAIVFGCEKYHLYLLGSPFTVYTDHRPLIPMFSNPHSSPPARIERWVLRLQQYDMTVIYRPGKDNPADFASRHPVVTTSCDRAMKVAEEYITFVASASSPVAIDLEVIKEHTRSDETLQSLIKSIQSNHWTDKTKQYHKVRQELSVTSDQALVLRGTRIVMPAALHQQAIDLAHEGHQGIVKSKQLLRTKVWFPGVDAQMEDTINKCLACQANSPSHTQAPLKMTELPPYPWHSVAIDFYGPLPTGEYFLVCIDEHSRYPVVETIHSLTTKSVVPVLDKIFALFGIPVVVKSDNGPPFHGADFKKFAKHLGFTHHRVTPLWPQANGEVERFMTNIGKCIRTTHTEGRSWKQTMSTYLRNYRSTPHVTTGKSPASIMFGRDIQTKLPSIVQNTQSDVRDYDRLQKARMKRYADQKRRAKPVAIAAGDTVLVRQRKHNKYTSAFSPRLYTVRKVCGTQVTAESADHHVVTRNVSHFKRTKCSVTHQQHWTYDDSDDDFDVTISNDVRVMQQQHIVPARPQRTRCAPRYLNNYVL